MGRHVSRDDCARRYDGSCSHDNTRQEGHSGGDPGSVFDNYRFVRDIAGTIIRRSDCVICCNDDDMMPDCDAVADRYWSAVIYIDMTIDKTA